MTRRLLVMLTQLPLALAILGVLTFVGGIIGEYAVNRQNPFSQSTPSSYIWVALVGLGIAAGMFLAWFTSVALLINRQAKSQGAGYGEAYRRIEAFKFDEAIPLLEQSLEDGKETVDVLMLLASAYAHVGRLADAQQIADRAVSHFPQEAAAYVTLSNVYRIQAMYDAAADALRRAVELEPESSIFLGELGFMEMYAGQLEAACVNFMKAAEHQMPAMYAVRVYYHLANYYAEKGEARQAVRAAVKMVSAREGLESWQSGLEALGGTSYGQQLARELEQIEQALTEADSAHSG